MMEDEERVPTIEGLMISLAKTAVPDVFSVSVLCSTHTSGFCATVSFRGGHSPHLQEITYWAETIEEALKGVEKEFTEKWGPCPHCGRTG
jgi:hypothetical protein